MESLANLCSKIVYHNSSAYILLIKPFIYFKSVSNRFVFSPRFELPMGTNEQPPLPQQVQGQQKVITFYWRTDTIRQWTVMPNVLLNTILFIP